MRKMYQMLAAALALTLAAAPQQPTPVQHARAGWEALNAGRAREAAAAFDDALKGVPQEPSVLLGAGLAAHLLGQSDTARRHLVDALKIAPA